MSFQTTQYPLPRGSAENALGRFPPRYSSVGEPGSPDLDDISFQFSDAITLSDKNAPEAEFTTLEPPRYSSDFHQAHSSWNRGQQPNAEFGDSSVAAGAQVFEYHIKSKSGNSNKSLPWATLTVFSPQFSRLSASTSSTGPKKVPKFTSKDLVEGCLELSLSSPLHINSITLSVRFVSTMFTHSAKPMLSS